MLNIRNLREQRDAVAKRLRDLLEKHTGNLWGQEQNTTYDKDIDELDRVDAEIKRVQRVLDAETERLFSDVTRQSREQVEESDVLAHADASEIVAAWTQRKPNAEQAKLQRAIHNAFVRGAPNAQQALAISNVLSTTVGSEGGFTVPSLIANELIDLLKDFSGVREVADVFMTAAGNPLSYPTSDGTAEVGELIAENVTATSLDPVFGTVAVNAFKYSSKIVAIPFELLQDTVIDMEGFLRKRLAQRLGRITNQHFTTGTGTGQPRGVMTGAAVGKTGLTGQTVTVIFDDLVDLVHSVNIAYRRSAQVRFMTRDTTMGSIRKLKDSQGRPIFIPGWDGLGRSAPDTVLGHQVQINDDVAAMAANARSIAFGDFSYYKVRDVMQILLFRFTDSVYARLGQVGFLAWMRSGGNLVDTTAVKVYVNSAT